MKTPVKRSMPTNERRHWARLSLAIPVFVRGINGQGREFLEFSTLLNESAGGVLLAMRKPLRLWSRVSLEIPSSQISKECEVATSGANTAGARDSHHACGGLESMWVAICPSAYLESAKTRTGIFLRLPYLKFRTDYRGLRSVFWWSNTNAEWFSVHVAPKN